MRQTIMKSGLVLAGLVLVSLLSVGSTWAGISTEVTVNRSVLLNLKKPVDRITLATQGIADIMVISPKQVQINGITIGKTTLIVWEGGSDKPVFYDVKVTGDQTSIDEQMKELAPNDGITVQYAHDTVILSGKVAKEQTRAKAEKIAQAFAAKIINTIEVAEPMQILLQVKVAQVDKTALKKLGISALLKGKTAEGFSNLIAAPSGGSSSGGSGGSGGSSSSTGILGSLPGLTGFTPLDAFQLGVSYFPSGIGAVITALVTKGHAKILAEPNLLVRSGQKGEFLAGSKIPYSVLQTSGGTTNTTIIFQDVGIKLYFNPEVLENGLINLKIDPAEVSSIAGTLAVNGYPIIDTRSVKTSVELRDGESLVMAGLLQEDEINTMSKIPLLGDIPILGALFRSTQKDLKEKELVFFVTPIIVKPLAPGAAKPELPTDKKLTPEEEKDLQWIPTVN